jgi:hypothetical protein
MKWLSWTMRQDPITPREHKPTLCVWMKTISLWVQHKRSGKKQPCQWMAMTCFMLFDTMKVSYYLVYICSYGLLAYAVISFYLTINRWQILKTMDKCASIKLVKDMVSHVASLHSRHL